MVRLRQLWLSDFRSYREAVLEPDPELTVIVGQNGDGKTNLLEAVGYLATLASFRGAPEEALVRVGAERAVVRAAVEPAGGPRTGPARQVLLEAELRPAGRDRVLVNRQPLRRRRDLLGSLRVTVFGPDDLVLVKGGPGERRRLLDETLVACAPRHHVTKSELDRVVRQRNSLLRQVANAGGRLGLEAAATLEVWDAKLSELGEILGRARCRLVERLQPATAAACDRVAGGPAQVGLRYSPAWLEGPNGLAGALARSRGDDLRRGMTTVGPHRDELELTVGGHPARTHASQGEQRSLALSLRLGTHDVVEAVTGSPPVLILDDVFSELDDQRGAALLAHLPPAQVLLTTTGPLPAGARPGRSVVVGRGGIAEAA